VGRPLCCIAERVSGQVPQHCRASPADSWIPSCALRTVRSGVSHDALADAPIADSVRKISKWVEWLVCIQINLICAA
jgi:hypothetical protein